MSREKYSIEVYEDRILFYGNMSFHEAQEWMEYFDSLGFSNIETGHENSCMSLSKNDILEDLKEKEIKEIKKDFQELESTLTVSNKFIKEQEEELKKLRKIINSQSNEIGRLNSKCLLLQHVLDSNHLHVVIEQDR